MGVEMSKWKDYIGQANRQFYCANFALKANELQKECFKNLLAYLDSLCYIKKSEEWIFNSIFTKKRPGNYELANIYAAKISLNRVLNRKSVNEFKNQTIIEFLNDFIGDIKGFVQIVDPEQDFSWLLYNTNSSLSHFYFDEVCNLLYGEQRKSIDSDAKFNLATLVIRHTLEQRIKKLIGLDYLLKNNNPVPFSNVLEAIIKLPNLQKRSEIDFKKLEKINSWANQHLHRGIRPLPWQMEWAENEIKKLFYKGKTIDEQRLSLFASFETNDLNKLREDFEALIIQKYPNVTIHFEWKSHAEINISKIR